MPINASGGSRKPEFNLEDFLARTPTVSWSGQRTIENADPNARQVEDKPWLSTKYGFDASKLDEVQANIAEPKAKAAYDAEQAEIARKEAEEKARKEAEAKAQAEAQARAQAQALAQAQAVAQAQALAQIQSSATAPAQQTQTQAAYVPPAPGSPEWILQTTSPRERDAAAAAAAKGIDLWKTTTPQQRAAVFASEDAYKNYAYKGHEWDDPLAQSIYKQYAGSQNFDRSIGAARLYSPGGQFYGKGDQYHTFINPMDWASLYQGPSYTKMRDEYTKAGGLAYGPKKLF